MGACVKIDSIAGDWLKITTVDGYRAWVNSGSVVSDSTMVKMWHSAPKAIVVSRHALVYNISGAKICELPMGSTVSTDKDKSFTSPSEKIEISLPDNRVGFISTQDIVPESIITKHFVPNGNSIISLAKEFIGMPYVWGGGSAEGFDCSGLSQFVYKMHGVLLPRNASAQAECGITVGKSGEYNNLRAGDLLFFGKERVTHVAIYCDNGEFIHASSANGRVSINSLDPSSSIYYRNASQHLFSKRIIDK